jgi:hypothetical protein
MGAITDLWKSERGLLAVLIIVAASVFVGLDKMTVADWQTFVLGIFITYAAGKTVTGAVEIVRDTKLRGAGIDALAKIRESREATPAQVAELDKRIAADSEAKS